MRLALAAALAAGEDGDADAGGLGQRRDGVEVLAGENFGRRHEGGLPAGFDYRRRRDQRHHGLAGADIALQQPQHALRTGEVGGDVVDRLLLPVGQRIGQALRMRARKRPSLAEPRPACRRMCARTSASASWPASNSS